MKFPFLKIIVFHVPPTCRRVKKFDIGTYLNNTIDLPFEFHFRSIRRCNFPCGSKCT